MIWCWWLSTTTWTKDCQTEEMCQYEGLLLWEVKWHAFRPTWFNDCEMLCIQYPWIISIHFISNIEFKRYLWLSHQSVICTEGVLHFTMYIWGAPQNLRCLYIKFNNFGSIGDMLFQFGILIEDIWVYIFREIELDKIISVDFIEQFLKLLRRPSYKSRI